MARTESNQELRAGAFCPAFELPNVADGHAVGRDDVFGGVDDAEMRKGLLIAFVCVHCPYLFDREFKLVYHGQFDETRPYRESDANAGVTRDARIHQKAHGGDLRRAIEALLAGEPPLTEQRPGLGCNIKWRAAR